MASMGWGGPPPASTLPTGPLPGESYEQYQYRKYGDLRYAEQQAEQRAYGDWQSAEQRAYNEAQQADARAYGQWQTQDARNYGDMLSADNRAYGEYQNADARAYSEARQAQSDAERRQAQALSMGINLTSQEAQNQSNMLRHQVGMADRQAQANARGRQPVGGITQLYKRTLGGY